MSPDDILYFRRRAREERDRALASADRYVAAVHMNFAELYEAAASRLNGSDQIGASHAAVSRSHQLLESTSRQAEQA